MSYREADTWRGAVRGIAQMLVVPQGFSLSVTGVFAITAGHRGFPGPTAIWLFVIGAGAGFCGVMLASGAHRETSNRPVSITGLALANLLPAAVVPAACCASWWIGNKPASFLTAGAAASVLYLTGLATFLVTLHSGRDAIGPDASADTRLQLTEER
ncbi:MAG TPA: hypothetical protein VJ371_24205 [Streptosporangiaceae bacterium]|nr:hypothetical protein [Streptosporangiaceae bacterium]